MNTATNRAADRRAARLRTLLERTPSAWTAVVRPRRTPHEVDEASPDPASAVEPPAWVVLHVEQMRDEHAQACTAYDHAFAEVARRYEAADHAGDEAADDLLVWTYERDDAGSFTARSADAPPWSWEAWRGGLDPDLSADERAAVEEDLRVGEPHPPGCPITAHVPRNAKAGREHDNLLAAKEARLAAIANLENRLERQRRREWHDYGTALAARLASGATVEEALRDTPVPAELPGAPLSRVEA